MQFSKADYGYSWFSFSWTYSTASRLGRASRSLDTVRKKTRENSSLALIGAIIVVLTILVLLIKL